MPDETPEQNDLERARAYARHYGTALTAIYNMFDLEGIHKRAEQALSTYPEGFPPPKEWFQPPERTA